MLAFSFQQQLPSVFSLPPFAFAFQESSFPELLFLHGIAQAARVPLDAMSPKKGHVFAFFAGLSAPVSSKLIPCAYLEDYSCS
jgi:hypothetical protein